jgi:tRNA uridine 5-carboxymethylaminomethyl modification enzyme
MQKVKLESLLLRPQLVLEDLIKASSSLSSFLTQINATQEEQEIAEILIKYQHYINKEKELAEKMSQLDNIKLPQDIDYFSFPSLSMEAREKLTKVNPQNLGQASRISGVNPSDIAALMIYLKS